MNIFIMGVEEDEEDKQNRHLQREMWESRVRMTNRERRTEGYRI